MQRRLEVDAAQCTGCNSCALTCSFVHDAEFSLDRALIWVDKDAERAACRPRVCIQCREAPCIDSCPDAALSIDGRTGAIRVNQAICSGCQVCVGTCPYGGIGFDEQQGFPVICDLCDGDPACVKFCLFPLAIRFG